MELGSRTWQKSCGSAHADGAWRRQSRGRWRNGKTQARERFVHAVPVLLERGSTTLSDGHRCALLVILSSSLGGKASAKSTVY